MNPTAEAYLKATESEKLTLLCGDDEKRKKATERASNHRVFEQLTNIIAAADFERKRAGVPESSGSLNRDD